MEEEVGGGEAEDGAVDVQGAGVRDEEHTLWGEGANGPKTPLNGPKSCPKQAQGHQKSQICPKTHLVFLKYCKVGHKNPKSASKHAWLSLSP